MEEKKNCYEELEGKTIVWFENSGKEYEGYVAGCDYDIGITIVDAEDKEHNLTCLNGPYSPNKEGYDPEWYDEFFLTTVDMIIKGTYYASITNAIAGLGRCMGRLAVCPFS